MPYINMIIKEALRVNPPAALSAPRIVIHGTELAGTSIPKGTLMSLDIYALHINPNIWEDPNAFNPERFADGGETEEGGTRWLVSVPWRSSTVTRNGFCIGYIAHLFNYVSPKIWKEFAEGFET
ncbi:cytochrome P450 [Fennellomyces sp. T-0311]|nr:cytochrome P450 [Fennellomyces sp. T-0311]